MTRRKQNPTKRPTQSAMDPPLSTAKIGFLTKFYEVVIFIIMPWMYFTRQIQDLNERLALMERAQLERNGQISSLQRKLDQFSSRKDLKQSVLTTTPTSTSTTGNLPTAAASTPPPPPPPPPPMVMMGSLPGQGGFKRSTSTKEALTVKKDPRLGGFDMQALMSVKLKKRSPSARTGTEEEQQQQQPLEKVASLVSLEALKGVKLKKVTTPAAAAAGQENQDPEAGGEKLQQQPFMMKLKKSAADRSPGGTPYRQAPAESNGDGFTPMLSNALKKKFKQANGPLSPKRSQQQQQQQRTAPSSPFSPMGSPVRSY